MNVDEQKALAPWIWEAGLRSMSDRAISLADRQVANLLLKTVFGHAPDLRDARCGALGSQMPLFGD
jgi:hypothetical protein